MTLAVTSAARPADSPGCTAGPQGFHIYDTEGDKTLGFPCLYCPKEASEAQILAELTLHQPPPGSVVLTEGPNGQAWQRYYSGAQNWRACGNRSSVWDLLCSRSRPGSRLWLIYVPAS